MDNAGAAQLLPGSLQQIQVEVTNRLEQHSDTPGLEAQVLLSRVLGRSRAWIVAHPETRLDQDQMNSLAILVDRRLSGEPLPYLLGHWEFFGLDFDVSPAVLIPRPETELLVEHALKWLNQDHQKVKGQLRLADIGTGSGCIVTCLALHSPKTQCVAVDISQPALAVAAQNVRRHQVESEVRLVQGNLLEPFSNQAFDLICANLPYIPSQALRETAVFGKEPTLALDGGFDGLDLIRLLLEQARHVLAPGGLVLLEIEASQGLAATALAKENFPRSSVSLHQDLARLDRLVAIQN